MKKKILGGIFGLCVADALGVPVEFCSRWQLEQSPVTDMRGFGTYDQPPGTWSDDTSMTLCLLDSLGSDVLDYSDIMEKFEAWLQDGEYTPYGEVFDVGITCQMAVTRFATGTPPVKCGGTGERDNGNGALMRILPLIFHLYPRYGEDFWESPEAVDAIHETCALTHGHKRSQIACGMYLSVAAMLISSTRLPYAVTQGVMRAWQYYSGLPDYAGELEHYARISSEGFPLTPREEIKSSGYVVDTLEAAIWCLLTTDSYESCVLKAVNLGEDTDTVAAVAGGLAGLYYGPSAIPAQWHEQIPRAEYIEELCAALYRVVTRQGFDKIRGYRQYFENLDADSCCQWRTGWQEDAVAMPVYDKTLQAFVREVATVGLLDYHYVETLKAAGACDVPVAEQIQTADLELLKALLTRLIRQERFAAGTWAQGVEEATFAAILQRMEELVEQLEGAE